MLDRVSEKYSALGNVAGSGVKRVLGKPPLDTLSVVIREAVQNSWDARIRSSNRKLRILLRFRELSMAERHALGRCLSDLPTESDIGSGLSSLLHSQKPVQVMEIADYGTVGLSGPESPQFGDDGTESTHFVDFIRNIGKEHSDVDGGTYGFGKSSFYALSEVSTIYIDSRSTFRQEPVQRLMFAALGNRFTGTVSDAPVNFTGRHWWGRSNAPDQVSPVTGNAAEILRTDLGLPGRELAESGTTVGVIAPGLPDSMDEPEFINEIRRVLLANFWTKMVPDASGNLPIEFSLEVNGRPIELPDPQMLSPFSMFAAALQGARSQDTDSELVDEIATGGREVQLGHVGFMPARLAPRQEDLKIGLNDSWSDSAGGFLFRDEPSHHFAVMRSGELVVRYFEGRPHPSPDIEWAGVFITSSVPEVERAFAVSEPPAHDDWNPQGMKGEPGRYVRAGLREIRRAFDRFVTPNAPIPGSEVSLGLSAARLGSLLAGLAAEGSTRDPAVSRKSAGGDRRQRGRFLPVEFAGYESGLGVPALIFKTSWRAGTAGETEVLRVEPKILLDGRLAGLDELPLGMEQPEVLDISADSDSVQITGRDSAVFDSGTGFELRLTIRHVQDLAITLEVNRGKN